MRSLNYNDVNEKKSRYILSLLGDGRVVSSSGFVFKANVPAGVSVTSPSGRTYDPGQMIRGLQGKTWDEALEYIKSPEGQKKGWSVVQSGEQAPLQREFKTSMPEKFVKKIQESIELFSGELLSIALNKITKTLPNGEVEVKSPLFVASYYTHASNLLRAALGKSPNYPQYQEGLNAVFEQVLQHSIAHNISQGDAPSVKPSVARVRRSESVALEKAEDVIQLVSEGDFPKTLAQRVATSNPAIQRICQIAAEAMLVNVKELISKEVDADKRLEYDKQLKTIIALIPDTHKLAAAEFLDMSEDEMKKALHLFRQEDSKNAKKVEKLKEKIEKEKNPDTKETYKAQLDALIKSPFSTDGRLLEGFKSNINQTQLHVHLLVEALVVRYEKQGLGAEEARKKAVDVSENVKRFYASGPFSLNIYVDAYAKSAKVGSVHAIRTRPKTLENVGQARLALLSEQIVDGLGINEILSLEDARARRTLGKKAVLILKDRLEKGEHGSELERTVLEVTYRQLKNHVEQAKVEKVPPTGAFGSDADFSENLKLYEDMEAFVWAISTSHKLGSGKRGMLDKNARALEFFQDKRLIEIGLASFRELAAAAQNSSVLGFSNSLMDTKIFDYIYENLPEEAKRVLNSLEDEELKHSYAAVQFTSSPEKFPLIFSDAINAVLHSTYAMPRESIVPLDEVKGKRIRDKIQEVKESRKYQPSYLYGKNYIDARGDEAQKYIVRDEFLKSLNVSGQNREALDAFLVSTSKTISADEDITGDKVGYHAESAMYVSLAVGLMPEGGSISFTSEDSGNLKGLKRLVISDANGVTKFELISHGVQAGLCDMGILVFDESGKPEGIVSSDLKVYDDGAVPASFNELAGFSRIVNDINVRYGLTSVPFAGFQQLNVLRQGRFSQVESGIGRVIVLANGIGSVFS